VRVRNKEQGCGDEERWVCYSLRVGVRDKEQG